MNEGERQVACAGHIGVEKSLPLKSVCCAGDEKNTGFTLHSETKIEINILATSLGRKSSEMLAEPSRRFMSAEVCREEAHIPT